MNKKYRATAVAIAVAAALIGTAGCAADAQDQPNKPDQQEQVLRLHQYPGQLVSFYGQVADAEGIFDEHNVGVELVEVATGPLALTAIQSNSLDITLNTIDNAVLASEKGLALEAITGNVVEPLFQIVARTDALEEAAGKSPEKKIQQMVGQDIGVYGLGGASDRLPTMLFAAANVVEEPRFAVLGGPKSAAAFSAGKLSYASEVIQIAALLEAGGLGGTYLDCSEANCPKGAAASQQYFFVTPEFAIKAAGPLKKFVAAIEATDAWIKDPENEDQVIAHLQKFYPAPDGVDGRKYAELLYAAVLEKFGTEIDASVFDSTAEMLRSAGQLTGEIDSADFVWSGVTR